jgi:hypothetical protein
MHDCSSSVTDLTRKSRVKRIAVSVLTNFLLQCKPGDDFNAYIKDKEKNFEDCNDVIHKKPMYEMEEVSRAD